MSEAARHPSLPLLPLVEMSAVRIRAGLERRPAQLVKIDGGKLLARPRVTLGVAGSPQLIANKDLHGSSVS
jgi:hypothetical protein